MLRRIANLEPVHFLYKNGINGKMLPIRAGKSLAEKLLAENKKTNAVKIKYKGCEGNSWTLPFFN